MSSFFRQSLQRRIVFMIAFLALDGCIEPYMPQVVQNNYNYLVVSGFLIDGPEPTVITLGHTQTLIGTRSEIINETGAAVNILDEKGNSTPLTNNKDGTYTGENLHLDVSRKYSLHIVAQDGREYASDFVPVKQSPRLDTVVWKEEKDGIQVSLSTQDPDNKTTYYLWTFEETWKYTAQSYSRYKVENGQIVPREFADELYNCWGSASSSDIDIFTTLPLSKDVVSDYKLFFIPESDRKLQHEYSMQVKQHALTKEAYEYWDNLKRNNELKGTLFDPTPSQDIGNIYCTSHPGEPVIGYFSASSVSSKRIFIDRQEITGPRNGFPPSDSFYCQTKLVPVSKLADLSPTGFLIVEKAFDPITQVFLGYVVTSESCADCRKLGGTINRPSWWR